MKTFLCGCFLLLIISNCTKKTEPVPSGGNASSTTSTTSTPSTTSTTSTSSTTSTTSTSPPTSECGTMTVKKDGISYGVKYLNSTLLIAQGARRLDIRAALDSGTFVLTVSDYDVNVQPEDGIKVQTYFQDYSKKVCKKEGMISYCAGMLGTYTRDNKLYITDAFGTDGTIAVSSMDTINRKVSGTFSFEVFFRSESKIFSGTFSNVCYTVLK